jgi:hypothetical protein
MNKAEKLLKDLDSEKLTESSALDAMIDQGMLGELINRIHDDKESTDLLRDVYDYFKKKLTLKRNEENALNRLMNLLARPKTDAANARNQIFKTADELKMKLPSSMF